MTRRDKNPAHSRHAVEVSLLQPHPDDVALSIGGMLQNIKGSISIYTVYDNSPSGPERRQEDKEAARLLNANLTSLGMEDGSAAIFPMPKLSGLAVAPVGVSRHSDHIAVRDAAIRAGVYTFWEDVAFWGIYGSSIDDRVLFSHRDTEFAKSLSILAIDITDKIEAKSNLLKAYSSQSNDCWRVLRYAWTVGAEMGRVGSYFERIFVRSGQLKKVARELGYDFTPIGMRLYGLLPIDTYVTRDDFT